MTSQTKARFFSAQSLLLASAVVSLVALCVFPFVKLLAFVLFSGEGESLSFSAFAEAFSQPIILTAIKNTFLVSAGVAILSTVFAVPVAWLLTRTDFPLASKWRSWLSLPYAIPPYVGAIAWIFLANPTTGLLNNLTGPNSWNIYSLGGLIWVETSFLYTFILLTALASLERMDSSFEEAARLSGASPIRVFVDVTLPLIRPALLSGGLLVFLATSASFGVPALIGTPARLFLVTTQIYTFQKMGSTSGILRAGALSTLLLVVALVTLWLSQYLLKKSQFQTVSGKTSRPGLTELGRYKWPLVILVFAFWTVAFALPMGGIILSALSRVQGEFAFSNFTLANISRVFFETDETPRAIGNSLFLASAAATLACALGLLISYTQVKTRLPGRSILDVMSSIPYSAPGTVVALALILSFSQSFFGLDISLYNTLGMLVLAYLVKYLSFATKTTADGFRQIDDVLAEAARVSGATWTQTMQTIWLPLLRPSLIAAWFLVFMPTLSELTMTILLTGPGLETIGTLIFQLQEYADASGGGASVLAAFVVIIVIALNQLVRVLSKGRYGL